MHIVLKWVFNSNNQTCKCEIDQILTLFVEFRPRKRDFFSFCAEILKLQIIFEYNVQNSILKNKIKWPDILSEHGIAKNFLIMTFKWPWPWKIFQSALRSSYDTNTKVWYYIISKFYRNPALESTFLYQWKSVCIVISIICIEYIGKCH